MYYFLVLGPAWRVTELLETTKASVEHPVPLIESVTKRLESTGASIVSLWS